MIGVVIRSHERRREQARALCAAVEKAGQSVVISWHGTGRTLPESYTDALAIGAGLGKPWVLQLEDDIELAPDFWEHASWMLASLSADGGVGVISFFNRGTPQPGEALPERPRLHRWRGRGFQWAQAFAMRAEEVSSHNAFVLGATAQDPHRTDCATGWWLGSQGRDFALVWPSLVQHGALPSLLGHDGRVRRDAPSFTARYGSR